MEALLEILIAFGGGLLQLLGEGVLAFCAELLVDTIQLFATAGDAARPRNHPLVRFCGYAVLGGLCGLLTLLVFPHPLIDERAWRIANIALTPLGVGLAMSLLGRRRRRRGRDPLPLERFALAWMFAFAMLAVRWFAT